MPRRSAPAALGYSPPRPKHFAKLFQISRPILQGFPKIPFRESGNFKGLQCVQTGNVVLQVFCARSWRRGRFGDRGFRVTDEPMTSW
jgi:hypothetical protein